MMIGMKNQKKRNLREVQVGTMIGMRSQRKHLDGVMISQTQQQVNEMMVGMMIGKNSVSICSIFVHETVLCKES